MQVRKTGIYQSVCCLELVSVFTPWLVGNVTSNFNLLLNCDGLSHKYIRICIIFNFGRLIYIKSDCTLHTPI